MQKLQVLNQAIVLHGPDILKMQISLHASYHKQLDFMMENVSGELTLDQEQIEKLGNALGYRIEDYICEDATLTIIKYSKYLKIFFESPMVTIKFKL
ncbi:MAG: hypothetical protein INQ03_09385 [Candidatus Heimdallarchaeota archaeon]|nr:hypothetical protein [Candidatus Heimdallarchaeota archaeon]